MNSSVVHRPPLFVPPRGSLPIISSAVQCSVQPTGTHGSLLCVGGRQGKRLYAWERRVPTRDARAAECPRNDAVGLIMTRPILIDRAWPTKAWLDRRCFCGPDARSLGVLAASYLHRLIRAGNTTVTAAPRAAVGIDTAEAEPDPRDLVSACRQSGDPTH